MQKKKVLRIVGIVLAVLALLLLLAGLVAFLGSGVSAFVYVDGMLDKINYDTASTTVPSEVAESIDQEEWVSVPTDSTVPTVSIDDIIIPQEPPEMEGQGDHIINIMIVGQDARPGEPPQRSDSMILMTFNKSTNEVTLTSFLRDQYVLIPGYGKTKLCHAYSYGGMPLLNKTLYNHYGIEVDGNVTFSFEGFAEIIDFLGGVDIELTEAEAEALNQLESKQNWGLVAGKQRLTGKQALRYSRLRHIDSDFQRTERQRKVILSVIEAYKGCTLTEMTYILEKAMPLITTNISKENIYRYAFSLFPMLAGGNMNSQRLPADGTFQSGLIRVSEGYMASCQYNIDFAANRKYLQKIFDEE